MSNLPAGISLNIIVVLRVLFFTFNSNEPHSTTVCHCQVVQQPGAKRQLQSGRDALVAQLLRAGGPREAASQWQSQLRLHFCLHAFYAPLRIQVPRMSQSKCVGVAVTKYNNRSVLIINHAGERPTIILNLNYTYFKNFSVLKLSVELTRDFSLSLCVWLIV